MSRGQGNFARRMALILRRAYDFDPERLKSPICSVGHFARYFLRGNGGRLCL